MTVRFAVYAHAYLETVTTYQKSFFFNRYSMRIYWKSNYAKLHPDPILNNGAYLKSVSTPHQEKQVKEQKDKMSIAIWDQ